MSLLTRILAGLLLVFVSVAAVQTHRNRTLSRDLAGARADVAVLKHSLTATRNSLNVYMTRAKATAERADKNQKELTRALQAHPDWRDGPVPDAVFDGLYSGSPPATTRSATR